MGILGIGVDVLHVPRILRLLQRPVASRFAQRILSSQEHDIWNGIPASDDARRTRFLAVRWSIKEAAYKAVYPTLCPTWKDFTFHSLSTDGTRKPLLEYHSQGEQLLGRIHASVSHDGDYVYTTVLVETP
ncbi:4'-phosphopantetheinyl transferase [Lentinus tigrinus ALCF2SS1-7]|uniref:4'-phosphopantetheinyl transferase n=1 Tax=Lentinus tigrinus ALCF2SS1-6 TaxID=1328759 RepID=A0A5C2SF10_9APHY|nr:4'-phosphopantetheinyl transferase [Lentinus tigrinus ALCF2SS1-6]RPD74363.1 4'-phosphopantetheinyl transferase [Lentinus tigrinus ALCF2SS1-7]